MSLAQKSVRGLAFLSASTLINIAVGFFGGIVLARLLTPNDFGTFALATTLNMFVDIRIKLQIEQKFLRDQNDRADYLDAFFTTNLSLAGVSFIGVIIAALIIAGLGRVDLAICLGVVALFSLLDPFSSAIRLSIEKQVAFKAVSIIQTLVSLVNFGVALLAAFAGFGVWSLVLGAGANALLTLILFWKIAPRRPRWHWDRRLVREFLTYGIRYGIVFATAAIILTQFDTFIIGLLSGTYLVGLYDRAYRTSLWPSMLVSTALGRISLPTYSKLQSDPPRLAKAFAIVLWFVLTLTTPVALAVFVTAPDLVLVVYGEKWLPSVPLLQILALFAVLRPLWDDLVSILIATGRPGQLARLTFFQALALIVLATPLTWFFGAAGTATSVGIAFMISAIFLAHFGRAHLGINLWEMLGLPVFNNALALLAFFVLREFFALDSFPAWMRLGVSGGLFIALYALISLLTSRHTIVARARYIVQLARG